MKTKTVFKRWLVMAAGLCAASNIATGASQAIFTDAWNDSGQYDATDQTDNVNTTGSFSVKISLPLGGVDLGPADAGTSFSLGIGPAGSTTQIISDTLGDAGNYSAGKASATFPISYLNSGGTEVTNGSVTVSWTATTISVTGSASGDILGEEPMFSFGMNTNVTLNSTLTGVYYEVSLTLDASDNGGGTFNYDNQNVPVTGSDKEKEWYPQDGSGPYSLESGSVAGTADLIPPTVTITAPAANFEVYDASPLINLTGHASDNVSLADVEYFVNGDTNNMFQIDQADELPTNSIGWTASVDLSQLGSVGSNVVTVVAYDTSGNQASVSRAFLWVETNSAVVMVEPRGAGTVKGIENGQGLQFGVGYAVTATPAAKAWIFSDWTDASGDVLSSNAKFEYLDTDGTLTANFVGNPFTNADLAGTYTGLFYDTTNGVDPGDAGYITVTVTGGGGSSGKLYLAASTAPFTLSGQFSVAPDRSIATADLPVKVGKSEYLEVNLQVATDPDLSDPGAGMLSGFVNAFSDPTETNQLDSAAIQGNLSFYKTNVAAGLYNVVMSPASSDSSSGPGGYSYGSATVSKNGAVALILHLADGTSPAISFPGSLAQDGTCPLYAPLYSGKGVVLGWMRLATDGSGTIPTNAINWVKLPVADKYYTGGFTSAPAIFGGLYLAPAKAANIFGWTAGDFLFDSGSGLGHAVELPVTFNAVKNSFTDTNKVTITFTPSTGALTGAFFYPAGSKTSFSYHGVEVDGVGYGFYTVPNETRAIWIQ